MVIPILIPEQILGIRTFPIEDCFAGSVDFGKGGVGEEADVDFGVFAVEARVFVGDVGFAWDVAVMGGSG